MLEFRGPGLEQFTQPEGRRDHAHCSRTQLLRFWWWRALCFILKRFLCRENLLCVIINFLQETCTLIIHFSAKTNLAEIVGVSLTELTVNLFYKSILLPPWNRDTLVYTIQKRRLWTHLLISLLWEGFQHRLKHSVIQRWTDHGLPTELVQCALCKQ